MPLPCFSSFPYGVTLLSLVLTTGWHNMYAGATPACPREPTGMGVLIPWYIGWYDPESYNQLASFGRCGIYAIVSGDRNGPPTNNIQKNTAVFSTLYNSGIQLFGYVHTLSDVNRRLARPQADVIAEVNSWYDNFGSLLLGIFFDEVDDGTRNVNSQTYYSALANAVYSRNANAFVVFNPGTQLNCSVAMYSDMYVRVEESASRWPSEYGSGTTCECASESSCGMILHGQTPPASGDYRALLTRLVDQARGRGFSYIFITDDSLPNPYDSLPSFFATLMDIVAPPTPSDSPTSSPPPPPPPRRSPPTPSPPLRQPPPPKASPSPPKASPSPNPSPPPPKASPSPKPPPPFKFPSKSPPPSISPFLKSPPPRPPPSPPPSPPSSIWRPSGPLRWQWLLNGDDFRPILRTNPQVIDIDVDMVSVLLAQAAELGVSRSSYRLICYFSVGTYEPFRIAADMARGISWSNLSRQLGGSAVPGPLYLAYMEPPFSEERWLAIDRTDTQTALVNQVMIPRMRSAVAAGCDGIEMDNVDTYNNIPTASGARGVTMAQQLSYNAALLDAAHSLGLSAGLKNALALLNMNFADGRAVANEYDWFLNEQCWEYNECNFYGTYVRWDAVVFGVEYCDSRKVFGGQSRNLRPECVCPLANGPVPGGSAAAGSRPTLNWLIKDVDLTLVGLDCRDYCASAGVTCTLPTNNNVNLCVRNTPNNLCPLYNIARR